MINKKIVLRLLLFIVGLFVMSFGVALSVKANLGVSPISCIPYVYSIKFPLTLGELTIIFNCLLIILQMGILRKNYRFIQLVQLPVVFAFGVFIDVAMYILSDLVVVNYFMQAFWCLLSCTIIAFGVFAEVKANITFLPGEGVALAIANTFKKEFGKAKIGVDVSMVVVGIISSFILVYQLEGIREGTIAAAVLVGFIARFFGRKLNFMDSWLGVERAEEVKADKKSGSLNMNFAITISREYGSGGHEIGKILAERLGIAFYDKKLIELTAKQSGFSSEYIKQNEQKLANSLFFELYEQNYAYINEQKPPLDVLFMVQSKIIRDIFEKESCVVVGRCANFVLQENRNCFNIFIHADKEYRKNKIREEYGIASELTDKELERIDRERENYCQHFTNKEWRDLSNYDMTINSSRLTTNQIIEMIVTAIKQKEINTNI